MNQEKLKSTAKKLGVFFKVLQKVALIGGIVAIAIVVTLAIVNKVDPDAVIGQDFQEIDFGAITIELAPEYAPNNNAVLLYSGLMTAMGAICIVLISFVCGTIRKILAPMEEGDPFNPSVAKDLKKLAFLFLSLGIVDNLAMFADTLSAIKNFGLTQLPAGAITNISANFELDLGFLVIFFVLLLASFIFRYGAELQQLSDETL